MRSTTRHRVWTPGMGRAAARGALALAMVLVTTAVATRPLPARTFTVLYSFTGGTDGGNPDAGLMRDAAGNLYGTTYAGGDLNCIPPYGCGTVFKVDKSGRETVLHSFTGSDGFSPYAVLVRDPAGNLYGTTSSSSGEYVWGTVFRLGKNGKETVLYTFTGGADGGSPVAGVIRDAPGNLYGTAALGGTNNNGVVFKLDKAGNETVLHTFTETDGRWPQAPLVRDAAGSLYGTTSYGGAYGEGTAFMLDKTGTETVLHSFTGGAHGGVPYFAGLVRDASGNFYGITSEGGDSNCLFGPSGCGVIFKLDRSAKEAVLYSFTGGADGGGPVAGLYRDGAGNLYGTTQGGGGSPWCGQPGCGTVFKLDTAGKLTVLHAFAGPDGFSPYGGLLSDGKGSFYGTTYFGGTYDAGVVFKITP